MRAIVILLLISLFSMFGCGSPDSSDVSPSNNATNNANNTNNATNSVTYDHRKLGLVGQDPIVLLAGEDTDVVVRLTRDGEPIPGEKVSFALLGDVGGAILSAKEAFTDGDGRASVHLTAGKNSAEFQIRITSYDAPDLYVNVIVSTSGFTQVTARVDSFLPERYIAADVVETGVILDEECTSIDFLATDLLYARYENSIPESVKYPSLPSERTVSIVVRGKVDGVPEFGGCVTFTAEEMVPHAETSKDLDVVPYDPPLPDGATCIATLDASALKDPVGAAHASMLEKGRCDYGVADALVDELVSMGWMCLQEYRGAEDGNGCRSGGVEEAVTQSSTAIQDAQDAFSCVAEALDGTSLSQIPVSVAPAWEYTDPENDLNSGTLSVGVLGIQDSTSMNVDSGWLTVDATKVGNSIFVDAQSSWQDWSTSVEQWLGSSCMADYDSVLSEQVVLDQAGTRMEDHDMSAVRDVLCVDVTCCPPREAIEQAWDSMKRDIQDGTDQERQKDSETMTTQVTGTLTILDQSHDGTPEGISCGLTLTAK